MTRSREEGQERGLAVIVAMFFVLITAGLVTSGTLFMRAGDATVDVRFRREAQATAFARSGLTEALSWFRRQPGQPVKDFAPIRDTVSNPQVLDTDDPTIGLVRDFEISNDIWGRYEVWREDESDPDPVRLDFRRKFQAEDLSRERGLSGAGNVWLIRSIGYIYQKRDPGKLWNERPNRVLASATLESESRRLSLLPPAQSAVSVDMGANCTVNTMGRVRGGLTGSGIYYPSGTGNPPTGPAADNRVTGTPALSASAGYQDSIEQVFGVSRDELRTMASLVITDPADFPDPVPENSIIFVECASISFDSSRSLNGTAALYIDANVQLQPGNNSNFNGLLYVDGALTMRQRSDIHGAVVVRGNMTIQGSGDYASVWYDDDVLNSLRLAIGKYRWSGAFRPVFNRE